MKGTFSYKELEESYKKDLEKAGALRAQTNKFLKQLRKRKLKKLDETVKALHEEIFEEVDCLSCANCCKTISPVFTDNDINRIAKYLRMKPGNFVETYLHLDEEEDYVLNEAPCPFLGTDLYCSIYEVRPKACREYPHTSRVNFKKVIPLTVKNVEVCPAAHRIVERLKEVELK
ncbi:MAG: YkgJ family cysteine cluster protein [Bacteroidota bacterium]